MSGPRVPRPFSPTDPKREREELARRAERNDGSIWGASTTAAATTAELSGSLAATQDDLVQTQDQLGQATTELGRVANQTDVTLPQAISDAAASPITDARLTAGSLTTWPFQDGAIPQGALQPGAVGQTEIADFSIIARKLKTTQHIIY